MTSTDNIIENEHAHYFFLYVFMNEVNYKDLAQKQ